MTQSPTVDAAQGGELAIAPEHVSVSRIGAAETIDADIAALEVDAPHELFWTAYYKLNALKEFVRERDEAFKAVAIEWLKQNKQTTSGTLIASCGVEADFTIDAQNQVELLRELIESHGPEFIFDALKSQAFKPATLRKNLEKAGDTETFNKRFVKRVKNKLDIDGKVKPNLIVVDTKFID